jgi:hypothetical protein
MYGSDPLVPFEFPSVSDKTRKTVMENVSLDFFVAQTTRKSAGLERLRRSINVEINRPSRFNIFCRKLNKLPAVRVGIGASRSLDMSSSYVDALSGDHGSRLARPMV